MTAAGSLASETRLGAELRQWLDAAAEGLDDGSCDPASLLPRLVEAGLPGLGVPKECGGAGGELPDAVAAIAAVSEHSLAAGLVLWAHRTYLEYLLQSPNQRLRDTLLSRLLRGELAGATGLSNAMKFLSGLEELQIRASPQSDGQVLHGQLRWVSNLRPQGFHVAAAVQRPEGRGAFIASLSSEDSGVQRSEDLQLLALRSTYTAAVAISGTTISDERILHPHAEDWLPVIRPVFLGLQMGMSIGLARRCLAEAGHGKGAGRQILQRQHAALSVELAELEQALLDGLRAQRFYANAARMFEIRIALAQLVAEAIQLELSSRGGAAYLVEDGRGFVRRLREAAFIPIITPTLVQLQLALQAQQGFSSQASG